MKDELAKSRYTYQLVEEVGNSTVGNIRDERVEEERPGHRVDQRFLHLIQFEVLVSDSLLVGPHAGHRQNAVFLLQPPRVELAVWDDPEEDQTQDDGQQTGDEEDDLPGLDGGAVFGGSNGDTVRDEASEDLTPAIKAEPDVDTAALFLFGVPLYHVRISVVYVVAGTYLGSQKREARRNRRFKHTEEEPIAVSMVWRIGVTDPTE